MKYLKFALIFAIVLHFTSALANETLNIGLATTSEVKIAAVKSAFAAQFPFQEIIIHAFKARSGVPDQPVSKYWGTRGAENRLKHATALAKNSELKLNYWVSIENFIEPANEQSKWQDVAAVIVEQTETVLKVVSYSAPTFFSQDLAEVAHSKNKTVGSVIHDIYLNRGVEIASDDWQRHPDFGGISRVEILSKAVSLAIDQIRSCASDLRK